MTKFHVLTLGCAKNRVDTEWVCALFGEDLVLVDDFGEANVLLVNTCAFIEDAREESIDTILEWGGQKKPGQKLVVIGCLPQRYGADLAASMPEVDLFVGTSRLGDLPFLLQANKNGIFADAGADSWLPAEPVGRRNSTGGPAAWLKVSEGCDRHCAYCAVPLIRGRRRSLPLVQLVEEARRLVEDGVREINLVAQDLSAWGSDLPEPLRLLDLLRELSTLSGLSWIRMLYLYPTAALEPGFADLFTVPKVVPYVDMPLQHVSSGVLSAMGRTHDGEMTREIVRTVQKMPGHIFFRTTFMVGHPGESEEDFGELMAFVKESAFHHVGVFAYSPEDGTASAALAAPDREVAQARRKKLMTLQQKISARHVKKFKGRTMQVLVEKFDPETWIWTGRHAGQAPEVDGCVILSNCDCRAGDFIPVRIVETDAYDLVGLP